jgi:AraC-like DNA-binding protein
MQTCFLQPSAFLAPYIDYYFVLEGEARPGLHPQDRTIKVFPAPHSEMVFSYGAPTEEKWLGQSATHSPGLAIGGYATRAVEYINMQEIGCIMVGFKPWGVQAFLDFELREITNTNSEMTLHYGREVYFVEEMLREAESIGERIRIVEAFLSGKLRRPILDPAMIHAAGLIAESKGLVQIESLAKDCFMSRRQLLRRFERAIGINPKLFARIVRFQQVFKEMEQSAAEPDWTKLAFDLGYFDQAHFINDFREFCGMTPSQFFYQSHRTDVGRTFDENKREDGLYGKVYL